MPIHHYTQCLKVSPATVITGIIHNGSVHGWGISPAHIREGSSVMLAGTAHLYPPAFLHCRHPTLW